MDLQTFFESTMGQLALIAVIILFMVLIFVFADKGKKMNVKTLSFAAIMIAVAFVINNLLPHIPMPYGGSATFFSMFFLFLIGYVYGPKIGIIAGMAFGLLNLAIYPYALHPMQVLLDYPLAFGMLGLGGFFRNQKGGMITGYIIGVFGRFVMSFLSGVIFFAAYAPEGMNVIWYSIVYNATYLGIEAIATIIVIALPAVRNAIDRLVRQLRADS